MYGDAGGVESVWRPERALDPWDWNQTFVCGHPGPLEGLSVFLTAKPSAV